MEWGTNDDDDDDDDYYYYYYFKTISTVRKISMVFEVNVRVVSLGKTRYSASPDPGA